MKTLCSMFVELSFVYVCVGIDLGFDLRKDLLIYKKSFEMCLDLPSADRALKSKH